MNGRALKIAAIAVTTLASCASALAQSPNPTCQRLEAQLASLDRGNSDPARAQQIRGAEDAVNRQQLEVDRLVAQSRRMGCESSGFFSIFSNAPPQCGGLSRQIDQQRNALERMQNQLEQLSGGTAQRAAQRQSLLIALGDNGCGAQYRSAKWAALSVPSACAPATAFISRYRLRPRPIASATTSRPASACARRRKFRSTPITIQARR